MESTAIALALKLHAAIPSISIDVAEKAATHAIAVATDEIPAELILADAVVESWLDGRAVSRPRRRHESIIEIGRD